MKVHLLPALLWILTVDTYRDNEVNLNTHLKTITMTTLTSENSTGVNKEGNKVNLPLKYLTATSIMEDKVINTEGEKLGGVKDIMVDITTGKIEYVIIEFGGFLGIGEKFFAIPFKLLTINTEEHAWVLDQKKESLEAAPGFDKDHWPKTNSHEYDLSGAYWGGFMGANTGGGGSGY